MTVVKLRRNFGQTAGLAAGFDHARGEYIIAMDGDLQHDPDDIPMFLEKIAAGYDIVSGWRKVRVDNFWMRRIPSRIANWMMAKLSGVDIHDFGTTFKAYRRDILEQVPLYGELHRFIPALASWYGASICEVPIRNVNRERGNSHYGISRTFRVFFDLITIRFLLRYLSRPLHFFGTFGMLSILGGSGIVAWLGVEKFLRHVPVMDSHGPLMMASLGLLLGGLNFLPLACSAKCRCAITTSPADEHLTPWTAFCARRTKSIASRNKLRLSFSPDAIPACGSEVPAASVAFSAASAI